MADIKVRIGQSDAIKVTSTGLRGVILHLVLVVVLLM